MAYWKSSQTWRKLRDLDRNEWRWLISAYVMLPVVAYRVRRRGFRACQAWLSLKHAPLPTADCIDPEKVARMVRAAANHHWFKSDCLPQSLWLWRCLQRCGIPCEIRLGVTEKHADRMSAHAWVEVAGRPLNEPFDVDAQYARFQTPSAAEPTRRRRTL